eukprot:5875349-Pyramimonas_sp.AAC.1
MLVGSAGCQLSKYVVPRDDLGQLAGDPYLWPVLNLATDQGPDMTCLDHYPSYEKSLSLHVDYDISHSLNNTTKAALRHSGHEMVGRRRG